MVRSLQVGPAELNEAMFDTIRFGFFFFFPNWNPWHVLILSCRNRVRYVSSSGGTSHATKLLSLQQNYLPPAFVVKTEGPNDCLLHCLEGAWKEAKQGKISSQVEDDPSNQDSLPFRFDISFALPPSIMLYLVAGTFAFTLNQV